MWFARICFRPRNITSFTRFLIIRGKPGFSRLHISTNGRAKLLTPDEVAGVLEHIVKESRYPEPDCGVVLLSARTGLRTAEEIPESAVVSALGKDF